MYCSNCGNEIPSGALLCEDPEDCEQPSAASAGSVVNGVASRIATCIGCKEEFEDLYLDGTEPDELPVCSPCAQTMAP